MSTIFWCLTKIVLLAAVLWGLLVVIATFGVDLVLRGQVDTEDLGSGLFFAGIAAFAMGLLINPFPWRMRHAARDPKADLVIKPPLVAICGAAMGFALMASSCGYVLASGPAVRTEYALALAGLLLFGAALVGLPLFRRVITLKLSAQGLEYSGFGCGPIAWTDIAAVETDMVWRHPVVTIQVRDEEKYFRRGVLPVGPRRRWLRWFLWSPFTIESMMFNVSPGWLRRAIQVRLDHFGVDTSKHPTVQRQGTAA